MKKRLLVQFQIFIFLLLALTMCNYSCSGKKQLMSTKELNDTPTASDGVNNQKVIFPYYIYKDGSYIETDLDKKPEIIGGPAALFRDIRYPAFAREHGIQGTVRITVTINEFGQLEDAFINSHVGGGCDEEGLRVVKQSGFTPAEINGKPVKVKYDIPLRFILQ
ncbi:MAG: energy transducer TonB [Saprospiraceae bacterium]